jgi:pentatricopeptide repeat protein
MNSVIQFSNCHIDKIVYHCPNSSFYQDKEINQKKFTNLAKNSFAHLQREGKHSLHMPRDEYIFNQLIRTFEERKQGNRPFSLNQFLNIFQFNPQHVRIYNKWLIQCKIFNHLELAILLFQHFKSNHTIAKSDKDCLFLYTILIDICGKNKRLDLCLFFFQEIENLGIKPDAACYSTLINACGDNRRLNLCLFYYRKMKNLGIKPDKTCYYALILACGKNHKPKLALAFWERMKKEGLTNDDIKTLSIVVDAFSWNFSLRSLEGELPSLLVGRVKALQKQGERKGEFDFHQYSFKLAEWVLDGYLTNKKDTSSLLLITGIGQHNKSRKLFSMKSHIIAFLENYSLEGYRLTLKPVRGNLGVIQVLFSKKDQTDSLASSFSRLIRSISRLNQSEKNSNMS